MAKRVLSKTRASTSPPAEFPIVGIGASAGGLAAIEAFFSAMPHDNDKGIAFVIVQHLSPRHKSILSELVTRYTHTEVHEAEDGMQVKANCTYIIPPNYDLALLNGRLQLLERAASSHGAHYPIDFFFRSLAADQRERAICIVLSGTGSDGSLGLRSIKGEGGMAIVQAPESAEFDGMPRSALATGLVDLILPPAEMPAQLIAYVSHASRSQKRAPVLTLQNQQTLAKIAVFLRARTGHDFSQYKENTIIRRVQRRMALQQLESSADYLRFMQDNPQEVSALFRDLLIGVTSFFRDGEAFSTLEKVAIPRLFEGVPGVIRAWVCACSTGEEAYSIAILIQEHLEESKRDYKVQIFATDIDGQATEQARMGVFPPSIAADVTPERLRRFFTLEANGSYRVQKIIRDLIIFSEQDVLKDPPFSKLGLISCRNLLIYLNADLQKRLMPLFHYALKPGGMLFLGNSETVGDAPALFENLDRKAKLYLRKNESARVPVLPSRARLTPATRTTQSADKTPSPRERIEQTLLRHFKSAAVLINGQGEILYFHGSTGNFLEPAPGEASSNILSMARQGLRQELASALHRAVSRHEASYANGLRVKANGHFIAVDVTILPAAGDAGHFVVVLDEKANTEKEPARPAVAAGGDHSRVARLEHELRAKDEYIRTIIEEMETSGEELKSSNEEMQSVNEEMQSTNEELETSKEELQSVNEELATLNAELQQKVADLSRANSDINSLLAGTGVGTLFVDQQLRIARFTPSITHAINVIYTDIGRPLAHVVSNLVEYHNLVVDVQSVLDTLIPLEIEAQTKAGNWYILGIRPYRLLSNVIEGVVITFVDITHRKLAEQKLIEAERFRHAAEIETVGIVFFKLDGTITSANKAFLAMTGYMPEDMRASLVNLDVILPQESSRRSLKANAELKTLGRTTPHERQYLRKDGTRGWALFAAWRISEAEAVVYVINIRHVDSADAAGAS
jgi:two-component system CheB/CheR fusion protein